MWCSGKVLSQDPGDRPELGALHLLDEPGQALPVSVPGRGMQQQKPTETRSRGSGQARQGPWSEREEGADSEGRVSCCSVGGPGADIPRGPSATCSSHLRANQPLPFLLLPPLLETEMLGFREHPRWAELGPSCTVAGGGDTLIDSFTSWPWQGRGHFPRGLGCSLQEGEWVLSLPVRWRQGCVLQNAALMECCVNDRRQGTALG